MGNDQSKDPEQEFIKAQAQKCGLTDEYLVDKGEVYAKHAAEDKMLDLAEFRQLFKDLSHDVFDDKYLDEYCDGLFRFVVLIYVVYKSQSSLIEPVPS